MDEEVIMMVGMPPAYLPLTQMLKKVQAFEIELPPGMPTKLKRVHCDDRWHSLTNSASDLCYNDAELRSSIACVLFGTFRDMVFAERRKWLPNFLVLKNELERILVENKIDLFWDLFHIGSKFQALVPEPCDTKELYTTERGDVLVSTEEIELELSRKRTATFEELCMFLEEDDAVAEAHCTPKSRKDAVAEAHYTPKSRKRNRQEAP